MIAHFGRDTYLQYNYIWYWIFLGIGILLPKISVNNILFLPNIIFYYIFRSLILPIFRQNEEAIDKVVKQGQQKITEIAEKAEKTLQENKNDWNSMGLN